MMKNGGPHITLLASDHPKLAHSSTLRPFLITRNMLLVSIYYASILSFKERKGGQNLNSLAHVVLDFLKGKWLKFCTSPTAGSFHSFSFAMIFFDKRVETIENDPIWCSR
eukprot:507802-Pelagomonas_calceolata.AAC.5